MQSLRIGIAGMRGKVASELTPQRAMNFASALGTYLDGGKVVVGRDTRISSGMLHQAAISALMGCGCTVVDAGLISAPEMHFCTPHLEADAGLLIGAGHHPNGWNALMPFTSTGAAFTRVQLQELLDIYHSRRYSLVPWQKIGVCSNAPSHIREIYLDKVCSKVDVDAIAGRNLKVVADFCNGTGSFVAERLAARLGVNLISINNEASGILPHDPEPRPRSAVQVQSLLKPLGADIGFVFNSDMSRASIVTSSGETLSEEYTVALVADQCLNARPNMKVITNGCTTRTLDEVVARHRGELFKTKVGEAFIVDKMIEVGADLAGDGSGSAAFGDHVLGYDNCMVMAVLLNAMAKHRITSAEMASAIPRYHIVKRAISTSSSHAYTLLRQMEKFFPDAEMSESDGLRFDWPDGWVHFRASNTEPIIRMIVEFRSREKAEETAFHIRGMIERLVLK